MSIDRIDANGNYSPENCRWITMREQSQNRRSNHSIMINGETKTLAAWCEEYQKRYTTVAARMKAGWSPEEALGIIPRENNKTK